MIGQKGNLEVDAFQIEGILGGRLFAGKSDDGVLCYTSFSTLRRSGMYAACIRHWSHTYLLWLVLSIARNAEALLNPPWTAIQKQTRKERLSAARELRVCYQSVYFPSY